MNRSFYTDTIDNFRITNPEAIIGKITLASKYADESFQKDAWIEEIRVLQTVLIDFEGSIYFEYAIPRMGKRIDVVLLIKQVILVLEFKVGEKGFPSYAIDQVWDYALDLKNFLETSHDKYIVPVLIASKAKVANLNLIPSYHNDKVFLPVRCDYDILKDVIQKAIEFASDEVVIERNNWELGRYCPTPTIIEAAMALYNGHSVKEISRSDASAVNLSETSDTISSIIETSKVKNRKSICFVTGVPGAGKTLVGLNIATTHINKSTELYSVFLSGNGPLVNILREALARDKVARAKLSGKGVRIRRDNGRG